MWKDGHSHPFSRKRHSQKFKSVLAYPKFKLTQDEIDRIIQEEVLPYFEVVDFTHPVFGVCKTAMMINSFPVLYLHAQICLLAVTGRCIN